MGEHPLPEGSLRPTFSCPSPPSQMVGCWPNGVRKRICVCERHSHSKILTKILHYPSHSHTTYISSSAHVFQDTLSHGELCSLSSQTDFTILLKFARDALTAATKPRTHSSHLNLSMTYVFSPCTRILTSATSKKINNHTCSYLHKTTTRWSKCKSIHANVLLDAKLKATERKRQNSHTQSTNSDMTSI